MNLFSMIGVGVPPDVLCQYNRSDRVDSEDCYALTGESRKLGTVVCKTSAITTVNPVEGMTEIENPYETE